MNRIDHRPAGAALNGTDGAQMQRHMLQELERQWLDSWGAASAAQPEAPPAAAEPDARAAGFQAFAERDSPEGSRSDGENSSRPMAGRATGSSNPTQAQSQAQANPTRQRASSTGPADAHRPDTDNDSSNAVATAVASATTGAQQPALPLNSPALQISSTTLSSAVSAETSPGLVAPSAAVMAAPLGLAMAAARTESLQNGAEPDAASARAARAHPKPQAQDGDFGPHKLTLRELSPDLVQATLRDTQLDLPASQLAAQGLARALMEAGYAQVRVVVNGQHSRSEPADPDDATTSPALAASPDAFTDSLPETAPKDRSHGN